MPKYKVTRVIHEVKVLEAPNADRAEDAMCDVSPDEVDDVYCPEIRAEEIES